MEEIRLTPIGHIHTDFPDKFRDPKAERPGEDPGVSPPWKETAGTRMW